MSLLFRDDIGANLVVATHNTTIPLTATLSLILEKPSGTTVELSVTPTMVNYTTGVITYPTLDGDLDEAGEYRIQVHGVFVDGTDETSNIDSFTVNEKLTVT
jgi:hypothetical protein